VPEDDWDKVRTLRCPDDLWKDFGAAATEDGTDRSALLKRFMRAYLDGPRARMPRRPSRDQTGRS
jgi:hypothetical protein